MPTPAAAQPAETVAATPVPSPAPTVPEAAPVAPPAAPAVLVASPGLHVARTGVVVNLDWTLPPATENYRAIEIMSNSTESAKGRTRMKSVRASVTHLVDVLGDAKETRWYWLKLTNADNTVINLGPVEAR